MSSSVRGDEGVVGEFGSHLGATDLGCVHAHGLDLDDLADGDEFLDLGLRCAVRS